MDRLTIDVLASDTTALDGGGPFDLDAIAEIDLAGMQFLIAARRGQQVPKTGRLGVRDLRQSLTDLGLLGRPSPNPDEAADEAMWERIS